MNLLEKFEAVTVKADTRITGQDKEFCEIHQAAYDAALQSFRELAFIWDDMENTQKELLEKLGDSQSGYHSHRRYLYTYQKLDISTDDIHTHIEALHGELIETIVQYFNSTYHVSVSADTVCANLLPREPERSRYNDEEAHQEYHEKMRQANIRYEAVVDQIILLLDGRSFTEQAFFELAQKCHMAAWNTYRKEAEFERKKNIIRFNGYKCSFSDRWRENEWKLNDDMKTILIGTAHFETGCFHLYPLGFSELLGHSKSCENEHEFPSCKKLKSLKMFKSGRVDLKFATEDVAESFVNDYLGTVC